MLLIEASQLCPHRHERNIQGD